MIRAALIRRVALPIASLALTACAGTSPLAAAQNKAPPVPGGRIDTLKQGHYACELPGDAGGLVGEPVPEYDFTIVNASSYMAGGVRGSYLHTGSKVVMTGGKLKGMHFERISTGYLEQQGPASEAGPMRCILKLPK